MSRLTATASPKSPTSTCFGDPEWMEHRLGDAGARWGCRYAEELDAWETEAGRLVPSLLPAPLAEHTYHPVRTESRE